MPYLDSNSGGKHWAWVWSYSISICEHTMFTFHYLNLNVWIYSVKCTHSQCSPTNSPNKGVLTIACTLLFASNTSHLIYVDMWQNPCQWPPKMMRILKYVWNMNLKLIVLTISSFKLRIFNDQTKMCKQTKLYFYGHFHCRHCVSYWVLYC